MQKNPKCADPHSSMYTRIAGTIDPPGTYEDIGDAKTNTIICHELILLCLGKAVGVAAQFRVLLNRRRLVQQPPMWIPLIFVDREGTHVDESLQNALSDACVKKIPCSHHRVQKCVGKRLLTSTCSQVKNHLYAFGRSKAVL